jgi:hypothetical protein
MSTSPWLTLQSDAAGPCLALSGPWRLAHLVEIEAALRSALAEGVAPPVCIDGQALTELDSAAGLVLLRALGEARPAWRSFHPAHARILAPLQRDRKSVV